MITYKKERKENVTKNLHVEKFWKESMYPSSLLRHTQENTRSGTEIRNYA